MELRHFRYFVAIAEEGSFVKASRRLGVAQPALSKQIQDLERDLGAQVFVREARGVRLTGVGTALLEPARHTLESAARAIAAARTESDAPLAIRFGYGRITHYAPLITDLLAAHRRAHPESRIRVLRANEEKALRGLREHRIDAAVVFTMTNPVAGFSSRVLLDCPISGVLLPEFHPSAAAERISLSELRQSPWFHLPARSAPLTYRAAKSALLQRGLDPREHYPRPTDLASAALHLVAAGGWQLATQAMADALTDVPAVVYREFVEPPIPFWLALVWRDDETRQAVFDLVETTQLKS